MIKYVYYILSSSIIGMCGYNVFLKNEKKSKLTKVEDSRTKLDEEDLSLLNDYVDISSTKEYKYSNILFSCDTFYDIIVEYIYLNYRDKIDSFHYDENINFKEYRWKGVVKAIQDNPNLYKKIIPNECNITIKYKEHDMKIQIMNVKDGFKNDRLLNISHYGQAQEKLLKKVIIKSDNRENIIDFIANAKEDIMNLYQKNMQSNEDTISIWIYKKDWWSLLSQTPKRNMESIYLKRGQKEELQKKLSEFYEENSKKSYLNFGVPYKYVVLLWGMPGTGKTSTIKGIASELNASIYIIPISKQMNDYDFIDAFSSINDEERSDGKKKIIVIEDIDTIFCERKKGDDMITIGLQNILNCIDGLSFSEGTVLFLTANEPQKIDYALLRSGRINLKVELNYADEYQTKQMYSKYFKEGCEDFYSKVKHLQYTTADLQELFFNNRKLDSCVDKYEELNGIIKLNKPENYEIKDINHSSLFL